ncbi:hypothetical protein WMF45_50925 [Sorangium sp. So ce448]|uniref:hypothetical protein n=1 Tax=Sorangium sp. So ce448 TaxID=3133314 RepID=UPI003F62D68C
MANEAKIVAVLEPVPAEVTALVGGALRRAGTNEEGQLVLEVNEDFPFTNEKPDHVDEIYGIMAARFPQRISDGRANSGRCWWITLSTPNGPIRYYKCDVHRVE